MITYHCPSCAADVAIENHLTGETVSCPRCGKPFVAEPPHAHPAEDTTASHHAPYVVRDAADVEETLRTAHPVMFRRHPWRYLFELVLLVLGLWGCLNWWRG